METMYVLGTVAIVVAWVLFLGGCAASSRASLDAEQQTRDEELASTLVADAESAMQTLATPDTQPSIIVIDLSLSRYSSTSACDVRDRLRRQHRDLQREIRSLRRSIEHRSTGSHRSHRSHDRHRR